MIFGKTSGFFVHRLGQCRVIAVWMKSASGKTTLSPSLEKHGLDPEWSPLCHFCRSTEQDTVRTVSVTGQTTQRNGQGRLILIY